MRRLNKEICKESALVFSKKTDFKNNDSGAYRFAIKNKFIDEICQHMQTKTKPHGYWTKVLCIEEAKKYNSRMEFSKNSGGAYSAALRFGFLDEICSHIQRKPPLYWNKERCYKESLKYRTKAEFKKESVSAFQAANKQGFLKEICKHMNTEYFEKPRLIYCYEFSDNCVYIGLTYDPKNRKSRHFCKNSSYKKSTVYKHLINECSKYEYKELTSFLSEEEAKDKERYFMEKYKNEGWTLLNKAKAGSTGGKLIKWTKEKCRIEALKYKGRFEFKKLSGSAFNAAYQNKWLQEICSHMNKRNA